MTDEATVERVAKALYAVKWEGVPENVRNVLWPYEQPGLREYLRKSARAAIAAYQESQDNG